MNIHSANKPGCSVCYKPVKCGAASRLRSRCANLVHIDSVPSNNRAELSYECPKCKSAVHISTQVSVKATCTSTSFLPAFAKHTIQSRSGSVDLVNNTQAHIPSTRPPFAPPASALAPSVSSTPKPSASPPSPSSTRDAKFQCPSQFPPGSGDSSTSFESQPDLARGGNSTMANEVPAYLTAFLQNLNDRMDNVTTKIEQLDTHVSERFTQVENRVATVEQNLKTLTDRSTLIDNAEILVSGLPKNLQLSHSKIAARFFAALAVAHLCDFIVDICAWHGPDLVPLQNVPNMQAQSNSSGISTSNSNFFGVVIKMDSTISTFPREVYQLCKEALVAAKTLNYDRPEVRKLTVCMRETRKSRLIPLNSEFEPNLLTPHRPPNPDN
ncbi:hypothetical protein QAD02_007211 [Eretmocerus hayati]|uniref:Uncharacterized protein n=1 Tax=Eretmocerus hayati TaxID=131215 RepID=A0ACC2N3C3_9HYME|nr:hypothetical protein QAD02_007211 [Eretmocerus hayati]